ncbi:MAG: hypothetical protein ISP01_05460 [Methanobrevibacter arboriphilus]|uniref:Uncharacterized protein n=1 Tax=Methanobrevibacter arboriphilus TaxID=39441 RepID=A0A843AI57_METAZ|nr:hypothetical protein [Methanobrevibacter arboriphilus]MBF4468836.1 hypothetical protein [Methanobrevibacter arboriphilus]
MSSISKEEFDKHYMKHKIIDDDIFYGAQFKEKTGAFISSGISEDYDIEIIGFTEIEHHIGTKKYNFSHNEIVIAKVHEDLIKTIRIKTV